MGRSLPTIFCFMPRRSGMSAVAFRDAHERRA
jgi:hypothetical protein